MHYLYLSIILYLIQSCNLFAQKNNTADSSSTTIYLELPHFSTNELVIHHTGYSLSYNELHEQANWVAYELTSNETQAIVKRSNRFIADPMVPTGTATNNDYKGSGYDRGHLAPAADMTWSEITMMESFYFSNISPQVPAFNRGIWSKIEDLVRLWAKEYNAVYVITGPVLRDSLPTIGNNKVSVPESFYKVILYYNKPDYKAIGFIIPNKASVEPLQKFAVTVDSVEKVTGINFFAALPDEEEEVIESTLQIQQWIWKKTTQH
jgi:endonuclease G, mitochondrial